MLPSGLYFVYRFSKIVRHSNNDAKWRFFKTQTSRIPLTLIVRIFLMKKQFKEMFLIFQSLVVVTKLIHSFILNSLYLKNLQDLISSESSVLPLWEDKDSVLNINSSFLTNVERNQANITSFYHDSLTKEGLPFADQVLIKDQAKFDSLLESLKVDGSN